MATRAAICRVRTGRWVAAAAQLPESTLISKRVSRSESRSLRTPFTLPAASTSCLPSLRSRTPALPCHRGYANVLAERRKELENLASLFAEARDEIENARESAGTTYFNEDFAEAKRCATSALAYYNQLLSEMKPEEAIKLKEEQNPKMEQLKVELSMLEELAAE